MAERTIVEAAPAKINLDLLVTGRRPDGYHELDSLVVFVEAGDLVILEAADDFALELAGPFAFAVPAGDDNLVIRAAHALAERVGARRAARIRLVKRLPVASGIGGGSSDAAATLRGLRRLWDLGLPLTALAEVALALGADVPACLAAGPLRMRGVGERIDRLPELPTLDLLLVNCGADLSTAAVFKALDPVFGDGRPAPPPRWPDAVALAAWLAGTGNMLTAAAIAIEPRIGLVLRSLAMLPGCALARMSGSGATCFALFERREQLPEAAAALRERHPGWWIEVTRTRVAR